MIRRILAVAVLAALTVGPAARADPAVFVGLADDSFKWRPDTALPVARDLGATAVRITLPWRPGQSELSERDVGELDRLVPAAFGLRIVVAVYGAADDAPRSDEARGAYCRYVAGVLDRYPTINDVVIWNEPNLGLFWWPQFAEDGSSLAPGDYARLLGTCWDVLHAVRDGVNVISNVSSRGNDRPRARSNVSHSPVAFVAALGEVYRSLGRVPPLLDTFGLHPYAASNESPAFDHGASTQVSQGDIPKLIARFAEAFAGTGQPLLGCQATTCPRVWLLESGFQTRPAAAKAAFYSGMETDPTALPDLDGGAAVDHARQLREALTLAYCQPAVGAFFNFLLTDEPDLADWQSGLLWADGTPKSSYGTFAEAARAIGAGHVDCTAPERSSAAAPQEAAPSAATQGAAPSTGASVAASDTVLAPSRARPASVRKPVVSLSVRVRTWIVRRVRSLFPRGVASLEIRASSRKPGWYLADGFVRRTQRPAAVWVRTRYGRLVVVAVARTVGRLRGPVTAPCDLRPALSRPWC